MKKIKINNSNYITLTIDQAKEWDMEDERFMWVCDTYGVYAHQLRLIERIEKGLSDLLDQN